jgi:hypothetical protein
MGYPELLLNGVTASRTEAIGAFQRTAALRAENARFAEAVFTPAGQQAFDHILVLIGSGRPDGAAGG